MTKNSKSSEKLNDLKRILEIQDDDYDKIIDIFLKYASTYDEAKGFVLTYLSMLENGISEEISFLILNRCLYVFKYYLSAQNKAFENDGIEVKKIIDETKNLSNEEFVRWLSQVGVEKNNRRFEFLLYIHYVIKNDESIASYLKFSFLEKIKYAEKNYCSYFCYMQRKDRIEYLKSSEDTYYDFAVELSKIPKTSWRQRIKEFLDSQDDKIKAKNKIIKIILILNYTRKPIELLDLYGKLNKIISSLIEFCIDPFTKEKITQKTFDEKYGKIIWAFEELMKTVLADEKRIIELFSIITEEMRYLSLTKLRAKIIQLFEKFYPDCSNADKIKFVELRLDIYIDYQNNLIRNQMRDRNIENEKINEKKQTALQRNSDTVCQFFQDFLASGFNVIEEYIKHKGLKANGIGAKLKSLREYDPDLYSKYVKQQESGVEEMKKKVIELIEYLRQGDFDIIDYYSSIKVDLMILKSYVDQVPTLTFEDRKMAKRFLYENYSSSESSVSDFLNTDLELNCDRDENGNPIQGTGVVVSREVREEIVSYLDENNIPLNNVTFKAMIKRRFNDKTSGK